MDEKKLTAEEIINGLDNLSYYHEEKSVHGFLRGAIGLIQDLQSDNAEQKAEIERLKAKVIDIDENPCMSCPVPTSIREVEDCSTICGAVQLGIDWKNQCRVLVKEYRLLEKENAELQKQVDELVEKNKAFAKVILNCEEAEQQAVKDTAKEIFCKINSCIKQGQEYCGLDWRGLLTAKNMILVWCKKKGVEVE